MNPRNLTDKKIQVDTVVSRDWKVVDVDTRHHREQHLSSLLLSDVNLATAIEAIRTVTGWDEDEIISMFQHGERVVVTLPTEEVIVYTIKGYKQ